MLAETILSCKPGAAVFSPFDLCSSMCSHGSFGATHCVDAKRYKTAHSRVQPRALGCSGQGQDIRVINHFNGYGFIQCLASATNKIDIIVGKLRHSVGHDYWMNYYKRWGQVP